MFSGSSPCLLGQHGSCSSAQLPVEFSENMLQNLFLNLPPQTVQVCHKVKRLTQKLSHLSMNKEKGVADHRMNHMSHHALLHDLANYQLFIRVQVQLLNMTALPVLSQLILPLD